MAASSKAIMMRGATAVTTLFFVGTVVVNYTSGSGTDKPGHDNEETALGPCNPETTSPIRGDGHETHPCPCPEDQPLDCTAACLSSSPQRWPQEDIPDGFLAITCFSVLDHHLRFLLLEA